MKPSGAHRLWRDIVQLMVGAVEEAPQIARGLSDALLVLDQREAKEAFAIFAKADARRDREIGLFVSRLENSRLLRLAKRSGTGAQANIEADGDGMGHPA